MRKLYLDLDGLGADWQGYVLNKLSWLTNIEELNQHPRRSEILKKFYSNDPRMFYCLPKIEQYQKLLDYAKENFDEWYILTAGAVEHPQHSVVRQDKRLWAADMFEVPIDKCIVLRNSSDKTRYATGGNILVDDFPKNCLAWDNAGGHAIHAPTLTYDPDIIIKLIDTLK